MLTKILLPLSLLSSTLLLGCITINTPPQSESPGGSNTQNIQDAPVQPPSNSPHSTARLAWEMSEPNAVLYNFIKDEQLGGGESKHGFQNNFKGAVNRSLTLNDVLSQHEQLYGAPVIFLGTVGGMHRIYFDEGRATMAGVAVTSDGTNIDGMITVVTPYTPRLTNGDVGYVGDKPLQLGETTSAFVVARGILTPEEAIRYGLKKKQ